jgi:hypothetical protein
MLNSYIAHGLRPHHENLHVAFQLITEPAGDSP